MRQGTVFALAILMAGAGHAQTRIPTTNPLQTLPSTPMPSAPTPVQPTIQPQQNPQLQALLETSLTPTRIDLVGVRAVPFAEAAALFQPLTGRAIAVKDLIAAAKACTQLYHRRGFVLSFCFVPSQSFADGVVKVVAVEGYVAEVTIVGDAGNMDYRIRAIAAHVTADRPLRQATFERNLQILGQVPGMTVAANVPSPTTTDGASRLELTVTRKRFDANVSVDTNHPGIQGLVTGIANGMTRFGEQLTVSALYPDGRGSQEFYAGALTVPLNSQGLTGKLEASRYRGDPDPGNDLGLPDFVRHRLRQDRVSLSFREPWLLDNARSVYTNFGIYAADQSDRYLNTINGATLTQTADSRVLFGELAYRSVGTASSRQLTFGVSRGLDALGAYARSRTNFAAGELAAPSDVSFTRVNVEATLTNQWPARFVSIFSLAGQYSAQRLPVGEQIGFGGQRFALAYDPGSATGDSGWGASVELDRTHAVATGWLTKLVPYVSVQYARIYLNDAQPATSRLGSVALGTRLTDGKHYNVDISVAQPVADRPPEAKRRRPRYNLSFSYQLR